MKTKTPFFKIGLQILIGSSFAFFAACSSNNTSTESSGNQLLQDIKEDSARQESDFTLSGTKNLIISLPSPVETAALLQQSGAVFSSEILNSPNAYSNYVTTEQKALNLGIYGTDLSYCALFGQSQTSLVYMAGIKKLSDELQISEAFSPELMNRFEANLSNKDSIIEVVTETYWASKEYLERDDRENVSSLVVTGSWVEGLYLACEVSKSVANNDGIVQRIAEQKYSINNLITLLERFKNDPVNKDILNDLYDLQKVFNDLTVVRTSSNTVTNENGVAVIGGKKEIQISAEQLELIIEKVTKIRNNFIS